MSLQASSGNEAVQQLIAARGGGSSSLPHREKLERAFGQDLGDIGVHLGDGRARSALAGVGETAAAVEDTLVFADANPDVETVAHEVAHALQWRGGSGASGLSAPGDAAEQDADNAAKAVMSDESASVEANATGQVHGLWGFDFVKSLFGGGDSETKEAAAETSVASPAMTSEATPSSVEPATSEAGGMCAVDQGPLDAIGSNLMMDAAYAKLDGIRGMRSLDGNFAASVGSVIDILAPVPGSKAALTIKPELKVPGALVNGASLTLSGSASRDASGVAFSAGVKLGATTTLDAKVLKVFTEVEAKGTMSGHGQSGAEAVSLMLFALHEAIADSSALVADLVVDPKLAGSAAAGMDEDDSAGQSVGLSMSTGFSAKQDDIGVATKAGADATWGADYTMGADGKLVSTHTKDVALTLSESLPGDISLKGGVRAKFENGEWKSISSDLSVEGDGSSAVAVFLSTPEAGQAVAHKLAAQMRSHAGDPSAGGRLDDLGVWVETEADNLKLSGRGAAAVPVNAVVEGASGGAISQSLGLKVEATAGREEGYKLSAKVTNSTKLSAPKEDNLSASLTTSQVVDSAVVTAPMSVA